MNDDRTGHSMNKDEFLKSQQVWHFQVFVLNTSSNCYQSSKFAISCLLQLTDVSSTLKVGLEFPKPFDVV